MCFAGKKRSTIELGFPKQNIPSQTDVCTGPAYPNGATIAPSVHYAVTVPLYRHYVQYRNAARPMHSQKAMDRYIRVQENANG